jgi:hypothetical protein
LSTISILAMEIVSEANATPVAVGAEIARNMRIVEPLLRRGASLELDGRRPVSDLADAVSVYLRNFGSQGERCAGGGTPFEVGAPGSGLDISGMQWRTTTGRLCIRYCVIFDELSPDWYGPTCSNGGSALGSFGVRGRVIGLAMYFD